MGYGKNGHQIRIRRIEKIRMGKFSAHIDYTKPSKHNLMYFPIALSSPLRVKPAFRFHLDAPGFKLVAIGVNSEVQEPSEGFPMASQELSKTSQILKNHAPVQAGA